MSGTPLIPDWLLERYALGELSPERAAQVRAALAEDPAVGERLAALARSDQEILAAYPPRVVAAGVRERAQARPRGWWSVMGLSMAATAAIALVSVYAPLTEEADPVEEVTREKGAARLLVHRLRGQEVEPLSDLDVARPSDRLQLSYRAGGWSYGLIASLDGRGVVTLHTSQDQAVALEDGMVSLPRSYELDDAPEFERFFFVTADHPFDAGPVLEAIERLDPDDPTSLTAPLALPNDLDQTSLTLRKSP